MKRTPLKRSRSPLRRYTPLRSKPQRRARPNEPLADWCAAAIPGVCTCRAEHRHHLLPRSAGGSDDTTADLCGNCHAYVHAHPAWAYENGWLRKRTA